MLDRFSFGKIHKCAVCAGDDVRIFVCETVQNLAGDFFGLAPLRKISAGIDRIDLNGTSTSE